MVDCPSWLERLRCWRRPTRPAYIYLYGPRASESPSSRCLVGTLLLLCLCLIVILTGMIVYHRSNSYSILPSTLTRGQWAYATAQRQQLPDFVHATIDPCENFYDFVCHRWLKEEKSEREEEHQQQWTRLQHIVHAKLMANANVSSSSVQHLYRSCETESPALLIDELDRHIEDVLEHEPYRSLLTIFNRATNASHLLSSSIRFHYNPFFKIIASPPNAKDPSVATILRHSRRPLPSPLATFGNRTSLNQTALNNLMTFDDDYRTLLHEHQTHIQAYEQEYHPDSLIVKRILAYHNYHLCLPSLNMTNGLQNLFQLLRHFLHSRLSQFNTNFVEKQMDRFDKMTDNHTLVEHLKRIRSEFKMIEQVVASESHSTDATSSCIIDLLDQLLDTRMASHELPFDLHFYSTGGPRDESFVSNDWPFLAMLHDRLLRRTPLDTLVNFVFFDYYRHLIYPYYQPHAHRVADTGMKHRDIAHAYTYQRHYPSLSCPVNSCFDLLNCYHPSALNQLMNDESEVMLE